jgi:hypothetical protein
VVVELVDQLVVALEQQVQQILVVALAVVLVQVAEA